MLRSLAHDAVGIEREVVGIESYYIATNGCYINHVVHSHCIARLAMIIGKTVTALLHSRLVEFDDVVRAIDNHIYVVLIGDDVLSGVAKVLSVLHVEQVILL